ncbi:MAG: hypothetical protein KDB14_01980, partial [Planctomycetales bacterium]|nr:hypothetical protein [Planctomycetales bacterium]
MKHAPSVRAATSGRQHLALALTLAWSFAGSAAADIVVVISETAAMMDTSEQVANLQRGARVERFKQQSGWSLVAAKVDGTFRKAWIKTVMLRPVPYERLQTIALLRSATTTMDGKQRSLPAGSLRIVIATERNRVKIDAYPTLRDAAEAMLIANFFGDGQLPGVWVSTDDVAPHDLALEVLDQHLHFEPDAAAWWRARGILRQRLIEDVDVRDAVGISAPAWQAHQPIEQATIPMQRRLAVRDLKRSLEIDSKSSLAELALGAIYTDLEDFSAAELAFRRAQQLGADPVEVSMATASLWMAAKHWDLAIDSLERAAEHGSQAATGRLEGLANHLYFKRQRPELTAEQVAELRKNRERINQFLRKHHRIGETPGGRRPDILELMTASAESRDLRPYYVSWAKFSGESRHGTPRQNGPRSRRVISMNEAEAMFLAANTHRDREAIAAALIYSTNPSRIMDGGNRMSRLLHAALELGDDGAARDTVKAAKEQFGRDTSRVKEQSFQELIDTGYSYTPSTLASTSIQTWAAPALIYGKQALYRQLARTDLNYLTPRTESDATGHAALMAALDAFVTGDREQAIQLYSCGRQLQQKLNERRKARYLDVALQDGRDPNAFEPEQTLFDPVRTLLPLLARDRETLAVVTRKAFDEANFSHESVLGCGEGLEVALPSSSNLVAFARRSERRLAAIHQLAAVHDPSLVVPAFESLANARRLRSRSIRRFADRPRGPDDPLLIEMLGMQCSLQCLLHPRSEAVGRQGQADWLQARISDGITRTIADLYQHSIGSRTIDDVIADAPRWQTSKEICKQLDKGQVAIEILKGQTFDLSREKDGYPLTPPVYAAWVVRRDQSPRLVHLGDASELDALVRQALQRIGDYARQVAQLGERDAQLDVLLQTLGSRLLKPLELDLEQIDELIVCPDGERWLARWPALMPDGTYLIESCRVSHRFTVGDLRREAPRPT